MNKDKNTINETTNAAEELASKLKRYYGVTPTEATEEQMYKAVVLTVKDTHLKSLQRQRQLSSPTDVGDEIAAELFSILCETWQENKPIRMITAAVTGLVSANSSQQLDIFACEDEGKHEKSLNKEKAIDRLRQKYGSGAIVRASFVDTSIGNLTSDDEEDGK